MDPSPISEIDLSETVGISRTDLKKLRAKNLTPGVDWVHQHGEPVMITVDGQEKLRKILENGGAVAMPDHNGHQPKQMHRLIVVRRCINSKILLAIPEEMRGIGGPENYVYCHVKSNAGFKHGQLLEDCEKEGPEHFYYRGKPGRRRYGRA